MIFGKKRPDIFTYITFIMNLILWITFMLWSIVSYYTIDLRDFIYKQKHIPIEHIIKERGRELGFDGQDFLERLSTVNGIGIVCWGVVFFSLILLFRKKKQFFYFFITPIVFYIGMLFFYISPSYFMQDTTTFDKIALLIMIASSSIFYYMLKNKDDDEEEFNFFGVEQGDEQTE